MTTFASAKEPPRVAATLANVLKGSPEFSKVAPLYRRQHGGTFLHCHRKVPSKYYTRYLICSQTQITHLRTHTHRLVIQIGYSWPPDLFCLWLGPDLFRLSPPELCFSISVSPAAVAAAHAWGVLVFRFRGRQCPRFHGVAYFYLL
jgi:hypothetical protein